jgi:hypothetical protein
MSDAVRATAISALVGAEPTTDGEHIVVGFVDQTQRRHVFALPRLLVLDLMGFLTMAFTKAGAQSGKVESRNLAALVDRFEVAGDKERKLVTLSLHIAEGAALEFALNPGQAASLSEALQIGASLLGGGGRQGSH